MSANFKGRSKKINLRKIKEKEIKDSKNFLPGKCKKSEKSNPTRNARNVE